jgi:hypothetical protein
MSEALVAVQARVRELQALIGVPAPATHRTSTPAAGFASMLAEALSTGEGSAAATTSGAVDLGAAAVEQARRYTGVRYRWGGEDPATGMDCSGLVQYVYGSLGVELPRVAADQSRVGQRVASLNDARPGDLVFFGTPAHHVGIYLGDGKMIDAPRAGKTVGVHNLWGTPSVIRRVAAEPTDRSGSMGAVTTLATGGSAAALSGPYAALFTEAGRRYGVDPALLSAVAKAESGYNPRAVSGAGAQGLMQLMPGTARSLGVRDAFDPAQAVDGAARLLADLLGDFGGRVDLALAGYNAGPGAVRTYGGIPPYAETQTYVRRVTQYREDLR